MAVIGEKAPNLKLGKWVQGMDTNFDKEGDNVKLVEVFQVNCPGCFMNSIPEIINIYNKYKDDGLSVMGVATAFEDYDKNTLENLEMLLTTGEVVGDTKQALTQYGQLNDGKLQFKIPYPVAMDSLVKEGGEPSMEKMTAFINQQIPNFESQPDDYKNQIYARVKEYYKSKEFTAETFEMYSLQGTPSTILVDRKGILRDVSFGSTTSLESMVQKLLNE
uniref:Alkyl hydroperoxide reductase/ Thiol specific antioxidant/ Mal allergen n=1 Tax=uncultured marine thaumarchaeote KM3_70_E10 TaxID=1456254 RepID=A0A075HMA1_9ARCH|nr:alkyl hydroperoxide reductase/ Thiol specific antioxidant/ Mal allergen [uncultured marine thaumarchaeote KM3_70_E10]